MTTASTTIHDETGSIILAPYQGEGGGYALWHKGVLVWRSAGMWLPISEAPKDGTEILLASIGQTFRGAPVADRVTIGHWTTDEECRVYLGDCGGECRCPEYDDGEPSWVSWDGGFTAENPPTHFMPLPSPPAREKIND